MIVNKRYSLVRREMIKLCTFLSVPWEFDVNLVMVTNFFSYVSVFNSCSEYNDCNIFGLKFTGWTHRRKGKQFNELRSRTRALGEKARLHLTLSQLSYHGTNIMFGKSLHLVKSEEMEQMILSARSNTCQ